ncbi:MAG: methyl-accepting chemotaxis protein [Treponema sp.]|nr:methyl-accepting chemotaxis protein [Treponema sp.]
MIKNSLKGKIIIPIVGLLLILVTFLAMYVSTVTTNMGETLSEAAMEMASSLSDERMLVASMSAYGYLELLERYNLMTTRTAAASQDLIAFVRNWNNNINRPGNRMGLLAYLTGRKEYLGITAMLITDNQGNVILRTHELERYGDSGLVAPPIARAFQQGEATISYSSTANMPMGLSGAVPIWDGGVIIGTVSAMVNMDTNEFVDAFGAIFNAEVTVFRGTESIASTLIHPETRARAVGTHVAPHVAEAVIDRGEPLALDLMIFGILPHHAFYFPLRGWDGNPVGMLFVGFSTQNMLSSTAEMQHFTTRSTIHIRRFMIFTGIIALIVVGGAMFLYLMRILKPLDLLMHNLNEIANGDADLTKRLPVNGKDEIAKTSGFFNKIMEEFRQMIVTIKQQVGTLNDIGTDLASNMTETASAMNEITANIQSIKGRVVNQSASVTETNATMEQVTVNIDRLNEHVERQTSAVSESSAAIEEMLANIQSVTTTLVKNVENVRELKESADEGRSSLQEVVEDIQGIARESEGLLEINSVMENIASQTNLLSMNAAIEAAHAGDAGRGFAVVADEIRKLAESSSEQSKVIGNVLKKIKESMDKITRSTDRVLGRFEAIDQGVKLVAEQEETIRNAMEEQGHGSKQVLQMSGLVSEITQKVKGGSQQMQEGSKEVIQETQNLERATQEITNGMNEMAAGAGQVNRAVNTVNELSGQTRENISMLAKAISQFKV